MSKTLSVNEIRKKTYLCKMEMPKEISVCEERSNKNVEDREYWIASCLNCMNPRCISINFKSTQCVSFDKIAYNTDMNICPTRAIEVGENNIKINESSCIGCGLCACACPMGAISIISGKATVNQDKNTLIELPVDDNSKEAQEKQIAQFCEVVKSGMFIVENDNVMKNIYKNINLMNQENQNLFVRNVMILLGNKMTVSRKGNVYMRLDGYYENESQHGVVEVETGMDMLDVTRAILDDIAVLNSRHGVPRKENAPLAVCLSLPNKRTDYWQVLKDIKNILNMEIQTITIGALLLLMWNNKKLDEITDMYIDVDNSSIRKAIEKRLGRKVTLTKGVNGILENEK